ncbi:hypothetical protein M422DRAFT_199675 [Sphaerobolus stellatus SS14]|nr:hypothetical protein M422DRAFT_199675 [Sphaerobolus stellatus SS14]
MKDILAHGQIQSKKLCKTTIAWKSLLLVALIAIQILLFHKYFRTVFHHFVQKDTEENWTQLPSGTIKWWPCNEPSDVEGMECGYVIVPMDYFNASAGVAKIALARLRAINSPKKGTVLFNFGGPGEPGKIHLRQTAAAQQALIGGDYDLVGFDPRGIGETEPRTQCFAEPDKPWPLIKMNTVLDRGFDVGNLGKPRTRERLIEQHIEAQSLRKTAMEVCKTVMGEKLRYMGTSTISRDVDFMTTILEGKNAFINYYGYSYGTILGGYIINMYLKLLFGKCNCQLKAAEFRFPNRIGRVVLDGVADVVSWAAEPPYKWYRHWLKYTEETYTLFFTECSLVGHERCPLAHHQGENPEEIQNRVEKFVDALYKKPMPVPGAILPGVLTNGRARLPILIALEFVEFWPRVAVALREGMRGNATDLMNVGRWPLSYDLERPAISCNDRLPYDIPSPEEVVDESIYVLKNVSRFAMSAMITEPDSGCEFWPFDPPERFQGPWNHTLSNPILIHSNMLDPITPLSSGQQLQQRLGNDSATLAMRVGPGHCSFSLPSLCTAKITRRYFSDGILPPNGHICGVDDTPFPIPDTEKNRFIEGYSDEDMELLKHLKTLRASLTPY